jgi:selenocysteine lyase/cysteine desulfurase
MNTDFQLDPSVVYLNHAAVAPWPRRTAEAVSRFAAANASRGASDYEAWLGVEQTLRARLARLLNAPSAEDVALVKNTSEALSFVACGLPWRHGDNVVSIAQEFPSNRIVWESLAPRGVALRLLDLYASADPEADLIALCDGDTRLVSVSSVQYARGLRLDLERIGTHCREHDILFCVDAIQQLGAIPFDVQAAQADFVAADGHKWMLGPEGLAVFYARDAVRDRIALSQFGWHMVERMGDFERTDWAPARSARRFECGSPNMLGIHALEASLALIEETGMASISDAIYRNISQCIELIECNRFDLLSDPNPERRSGILTFRVPGLDQGAMHKALMRRGVVCALRGGGIRFSPHFHTSPRELERAFAILKDARHDIIGPR